MGSVWNLTAAAFPSRPSAAKTSVGTKDVFHLRFSPLTFVWTAIIAVGQSPQLSHGIEVFSCHTLGLEFKIAVANKTLGAPKENEEPTLNSTIGART